MWRLTCIPDMRVYHLDSAATRVVGYNQARVYNVYSLTRDTGARLMLHLVIYRGPIILLNRFSSMNINRMTHFFDLLESPPSSHNCLL